jgi:hypothetical protein
LTAPWSKIAGQRYAVGILIVSAAAGPQFMASMLSYASTPYAIGGQTQRIYGQVNGQADLPATIANSSIGYSNQAAYTEVLP